MADLIVNLDYVSVLRDKRKGNVPDPLAAAVVAEMAGAHAIAIHIRGDRKNVQERDVRLLREVVRTRLHLSLGPVNESVKLAYAVKPDVVTLVPERLDEVSPAVGLDVLLNQAPLKKVVRALKEVGVRVGVLVDPDADQVKAVLAVEAEILVLSTRLYADSAREREARDELDKVEAAARIGRKLGLRVFAAHGLDTTNIAPVARLRDIDAIEVGHALLARALFVGLERAVREMRALAAGVGVGAE